MTMSVEWNDVIIVIIVVTYTYYIIVRPRVYADFGAAIIIGIGMVYT